MKNKIIYVSIILFAFLLGSGFNFVLLTYLDLDKNQSTTKTINEIKVEETQAESAVEKVYDAVVVIETYKGNQLIGSGTGFLYRIDTKYGYIITNHHVVAGGDVVKAKLTSGTTVETKVMGSDPYGDIAVLRIDKKDGLTVAEISTTESVKVGSTVFAIGSPIGSEYSGTTTRGCISGKNRMLPISINGTGSNDWIMRVVQTDAAINPGNSGGPLINLAGQVIGVTSLKLVDGSIEGIGFAIPIEDVMKYVSKLEKGESIVRPVLGVSLIDVDDTITLFYEGINIDKNIQNGVVIESVVANSGANTAGLLRGDIITEINGENVDNMAELRYELFKYNVGDKIKITFIRGQTTKMVDITLSSK